MAKHSRIFVRSGDDLFYLMWMDTSADGSVLLGIAEEGEGRVEVVADPHLGELRADDLVAPKAIGALKISFHASGQYKLSGRMGRDACSIDRITVTGPRPAEIVEPRMMAEILLPQQLLRATRAPTDRDITIDISAGLPPPHRCSISCMSTERFEAFIASNARLVDTSEWEAINALTNGPKVWAWVIRKSRNDMQIPRRFLIFLPGFPKWGQPNRDI